MDDRETLEARLRARGSKVLDVYYYCCVYVVHVVYLVILPMVICNVVYAVLCTYDVVCLCIYGVVYVLHILCQV